MELLTPVFVQNESWFQEWLPIRWKAIFGAEAGPGMVAMLCPPRLHNFVLVGIERRMVFVPMFIIISVL
jgi:hypothetical protein